MRLGNHNIAKLIKKHTANGWFNLKLVIPKRVKSTNVPGIRHLTHNCELPTLFQLEVTEISGLCLSGLKSPVTEATILLGLCATYVLVLLIQNYLKKATYLKIKTTPPKSGQWDLITIYKAPRDIHIKWDIGMPSVVTTFFCFQLYSIILCLLRDFNEVQTKLVQH